MPCRYAEAYAAGGANCHGYMHPIRWFRVQTTPREETHGTTARPRRKPRRIFIQGQKKQRTPNRVGVAPVLPEKNIRRLGYGVQGYTDTSGWYRVWGSTDTATRVQTKTLSFPQWSACSSTARPEDSPVIRLTHLIEIPFKTLCFEVNSRFCVLFDLVTLFFDAFLD